jgi:hypothetical protein
LQDVVTANNAEEARPPADSETKGDDREQEPPVHIAANGHGAGDEGVSAGDGETGQESGRAESEDPTEKLAAENGVHHASHQNREAAEENLAEDIDFDSLTPDPDEKIGPHLPTLLERLRSIGEDHAESDKPSSPPRA